MTKDSTQVQDATETAKETPQALATRIPKILHVIWIGPHDPPQEMIDSWANKNVNGWFFHLWRDHTGWINQEHIDARMRIREFNGAADIIRWEILARYGGICADADSQCMRALDEGPLDLLGNEFFSCYEHELLLPGQVACGLMGSVKGSRIATAAVEACAAVDLSKQAWRAVGPLLLTRLAQEMPDAITVYPARVAAPKHHSGKLAPGDAPIYAEQFWAGGQAPGYNKLRKTACKCRECAVSMLRAPWG